MISIANMETVPTNDQFEGFTLIQETKKMAEQIMIRKLIERSKVTKVIPTLTTKKTSYRMRDCSIEIETFR